MNPQARERLRKISTKVGVEIFQTPRVLEFEVAQALRDLPAERDALIAALKQDCIEPLRTNPGQLDALIGELTKKTKLEQADAVWALESWRDLIPGVRSKTLDTGDAYLAHEKTKGMSYRPPTREQFARSGLIAGVLAGVLVGAFWGGVKAISLGRPISRTVDAYSYNRFDRMQLGSRSPMYQRTRVDLEFTGPSIIAWLGWIVAGGLIGTVAGGTAALYLSRGSMRFVGGYSGAVVGAIAGLMTGHRLVHVAPLHGSTSDMFAQALASI